MCQNGLNKDYLEKCKEYLDTITMKTDAVPRATICSDSHSYNNWDGTLLNYKAYHIFESNRIQEQFYAVNILMKAFELTKDEFYLNYAINTMLNLIEQHILDNGMIDRCNAQDYTTVTAPIINIVDMALELKRMKNPLWKILFEKCEKIADFLVERGEHFPSEGEQAEGKDEEREEGSISCTALSVLYVCYFVKYKDQYVQFAKELLAIHNAFMLYYPDVKMYGSSFRWWETIWEGDEDGPAICSGHAWSIWRGEAEFYLGLLTNDVDALLNSFNTFMTNYSKIDKDGFNYACYCPDYILGNYNNKEGIQYGHRYPRKRDNSLSRYALLRGMNTWDKTSGMYKNQCINCKMEDNTIVPNTTTLEYFFVKGFKGTINLNSNTFIQLIT